MNKMRTNKKGLTILVLVAMLFTIMPVSALAGESNSVASVTIDGTTTEYTSFTDALNAAMNASTTGSTLKLLDDVTLASTTSIHKGVFTLDLNGNTIGGQGFYLQSNDTHITVKDSSNSQKGCIQIQSIEGVSNPAFAISHGASLTMDGGTLSGDPAIFMYNNAGTVIINGGSIINKGANGIRVEGGTFIATAGTIMYQERLGVFACGGNITIQSGVAIKAMDDATTCVGYNGGILKLETSSCNNWEIMNFSNTFSLDNIILPADYSLQDFEGNVISASGIGVVYIRDHVDHLDNNKDHSCDKPDCNVLSPHNFTTEGVCDICEQIAELRIETNTEIEYMMVDDIYTKEYENATIKLLKDVAPEYLFEINGENNIFDLNGYSIDGKFVNEAVNLDCENIKLIGPGTIIGGQECAIYIDDDATIGKDIILEVANDTAHIRIDRSKLNLSECGCNGWRIMNDHDEDSLPCADITLPSGYIFVDSTDAKITVIAPENMATIKDFRIIPTVTAPEVIDGLVYDGTTQELVTAGSTDGGTLQYSLDNETWSTNIPTAVNAGDYTVYYRVQGNDNYKDVAVQSVDVFIAKAPLTITANSYTLNTGSAIPDLAVADAYTISGFVNGEDESLFNHAPKLYYDPTPDTDDMTEAGYWTSIHAVEDIIASNYEICYESGTLKVVDCIHNFTEYYLGTVNEEGDSVFAKCSNGCEEYGDGNALITICAPENAVYEQGLYHTASLLGYDSQIELDSEDIVYDGEPINAGSYTASITYGDVTASVEYEVEKAYLTVSANILAKIGDAVPELTYTITGFTGDEDESVINGTPVLRYDETPDMSKEGYYMIYVDVEWMSADNYDICSEDGSLRVVKCIHNFTEYSLGTVNVAGDSIFAKCSHGCEEYGDGDAIITLYAPEDAVYDEGLYHNVSIIYNSQIDVDSDDVEYSDDPVDVGTYTASITYGDITASVTYEVVSACYEAMFELENLTADGADRAEDGKDYTALLTPMDGYTAPMGIEVKVGDAVLDTDLYGYTFKMAYDGEGNGYYVGKLTIPAEVITDDICISAKADAVYHVRLNSNYEGGAKLVLPVNEGMSVYERHGIETYSLNRDGYTFKGWYTSQDNGKTLDALYDFKTAVTKDAVLYAKWAKNSTGAGGVYIPSVPSVEAEVTVPDTLGDDVDATTDNITTSTLNEVKDMVANDDNLTVIGGKNSAVQITAKENGKALDGFTQPVSITVPVSKSDIKNVKDTGNLTLALVTEDEEGNTVLEYVGGKYDEETGTFTAYTNKPGDYVLVEKDDLIKIELTIDHAVAMVNGEPVVKDVPSRIVNDRTIVPARFVLEHMGCDIDWDEATRTVAVILPDGRVLSMPVDEPIPGFGTAPMIENGRTLVPIAYIAHAMDCHVLWVEDERKVIIVK